jgi:hypothetical protein
MSTIEQRLDKIEERLGIKADPTWEQIDAWLKEGSLQVLFQRHAPYLTAAQCNNFGWSNWNELDITFHLHKYHPSRFRRDPNFVAKDPYAEAKQAWRDGCLQLFTNTASKWRDWLHDVPPVWTNLRPEQFRRKPEEKKAVGRIYGTLTTSIFGLPEEQCRSIAHWVKDNTCHGAESQGTTLLLTVKK